MNRRQFLHYLSILGLSACAPTTFETRSPEISQIKHKPIWDWGPSPSKVFSGNTAVPSIVGTSPAQNPRSFNVEHLVREAVEKAGNFDKIGRPGDEVLIKPNLVQNIPSGTGFTTHTQVAGAVARIALDCGARKIIFGEGSASNHPVSKYGEWGRENTERCFDVGGQVDLAKKLGASLVDLNDAGGKPGGREFVREVQLKYGLKRKSYWISKFFWDVDRVISVPVLKNHESAGVTLSLKNYIGIAPADIYHVSGATQGKNGLDHSTLPKIRKVRFRINEITNSYRYSGVKNSPIPLAKFQVFSICPFIEHLKGKTSLRKIFQKIRLTRSQFRPN